MITCIECGNEISSEAGSCPKCRTSYPKGRRCEICQLRGRELSILNSKSSSDFTYYAHSHCIEEVKREQEANGTCSVCRKDVVFVFRSYHGENYTCPECGHPKTIPTERCPFCSGRVIVSRGVKAYLPATGGLEAHFAHTACSRNREIRSQGFCFIATAAFESGEAPEVIFLREFRDDVLLKYLAGRTFVDAYYRLSPPLARIISHSPVLKHSCRTILSRLVRFLK